MGDEEETLVHSYMRYNSHPMDVERLMSEVILEGEGFTADYPSGELRGSAAYRANQEKTDKRLHTFFKSSVVEAVEFMGQEEGMLKVRWKLTFVLRWGWKERNMWGYNFYRFQDGRISFVRTVTDKQYAKQNAASAK